MSDTRGLNITKEVSTQSSSAIGRLLVGIVALAVLAACSSTEESSSGKSRPSEPDTVDIDVMNSTAFDVCKDFVKDRLKAPATARFPDYFDKDGEVTVSNVGTTYTVISHVDSENSFGALLATPFTCKVTNTSEDNWNLEDLTLAE